jgi:hypothetical protein
MKKRIALLALFLPMVLAGCSHPQPAPYYPPPPPPPQAFASVAQQGFHDGFEAAERDVREGRPPDLDRHPRFRNPPVPPLAIEDYRHSFREGYNNFLHHGPRPRDE